MYFEKALGRNLLSVTLIGMPDFLSYGGVDWKRYEGGAALFQKGIKYFTTDIYCDTFRWENKAEEKQSFLASMNL